MIRRCWVEESLTRLLQRLPIPSLAIGALTSTTGDGGLNSVEDNGVRNHYSQVPSPSGISTEPCPIAPLGKNGVR